MKQEAKNAITDVQMAYEMNREKSIRRAEREALHVAYHGCLRGTEHRMKRDHVIN